MTSGSAHPAIAVRDVAVPSRLRSTSLTIDHGSITALIGPNGAGKSTLLQVIAGEVRHRGSVLIDDHDVDRTRPRALARLRAVLDQDPSVTFGFTVREVVTWGRDCWRGTPSEHDDSAIVDMMLAEHGIEHLASRRVNDLSGGERQRVHLARVRAQRAPVLLLDEADSDLDIEGRFHLDEAIRREAAAGTAIVLVSHDLMRLGSVAHRVIALTGGLVTLDGPPSAVLDPSQISVLFGVPWG